MIMQIVNILLSVAVFIEVVYLFTCGQQYMKMSILRARRRYFLEKVVYASVGFFSFYTGLFFTDVSVSHNLLMASITALLGLKCHSVYYYRNKSKIIK